MKEVNKLNDTIAQQYTLFIFIRRFMLLTLSKDQTVSLLWFSELLVIMIKNDLYVNFEASDSRDTFLMPHCVCTPSDTPPHTAFG